MRFSHVLSGLSELCSCCFCVVFSDDEQEEVEPAGPSQTDYSCGDATPNRKSDGNTTEPQAEENHIQPLPDHGDPGENSNGSQSQTEPGCSGDANSADDMDPGEQSSGPAGADRSSKPPAEQPHEPTEEENEEDKQEEACSPSPPANEHPAKRRVCHVRRKRLFSIQAVNSNGTTERGMGEGGSAVSFSCECERTNTTSVTSH